MFTAEQAVHYAGELKARGALIDISTLDCIETRWRNDAVNIDALIEAGYVDTISTDFAGSHWDGILKAVHRMVRNKQLSAPAAVALATGNVANIFPQLAGDRGLLAKGRRADVVITDSTNLSRVKHVLIAGRLVVRNGALRRP
jgi:alpha-D-ribose 1-methylphosphonate 5-triphosphate diphosphatase PhnM